MSQLPVCSITILDPSLFHFERKANISQSCQFEISFSDEEMSSVYPSLQAELVYADGSPLEKDDKSNVCINLEGGEQQQQSIIESKLALPKTEITNILNYLKGKKVKITTNKGIKIGYIIGSEEGISVNQSSGFSSQNIPKTLGYAAIHFLEGDNILNIRLDELISIVPQEKQDVIQFQKLIINSNKKESDNPWKVSFFINIEHNKSYQLKVNYDLHVKLSDNSILNKIYLPEELLPEIKVKKTTFVLITNDSQENWENIKIFYSKKQKNQFTITSVYHGQSTMIPCGDSIEIEGKLYSHKNQLELELIITNKDEIYYNQYKKPDKSIQFPGITVIIDNSNRIITKQPFSLRFIKSKKENNHLVYYSHFSSLNLSSGCEIFRKYETIQSFDPNIEINLLQRKISSPSTIIINNTFKLINHSDVQRNFKFPAVYLQKKSFSSQNRIESISSSSSDCYDSIFVYHKVDKNSEIEIQVKTLISVQSFEHFHGFDDQLFSQWKEKFAFTDNQLNDLEKCLQLSKKQTQLKFKLNEIDLQIQFVTSRNIQINFEQSQFIASQKTSINMEQLSIEDSIKNLSLNFKKNVEQLETRDKITNQIDFYNFSSEYYKNYRKHQGNTFNFGASPQSPSPFSFGAPQGPSYKFLPSTVSVFAPSKSANLFAQQQALSSFNSQNNQINSENVSTGFSFGGSTNENNSTPGFGSTTPQQSAFGSTAPPQSFNQNFGSITTSGFGSATTTPGSTTGSNLFSSSIPSTTSAGANNNSPAFGTNSSFGNTDGFSFGASNNPAPQQSAFGSSNENNTTTSVSNGTSLFGSTASTHSTNLNNNNASAGTNNAFGTNSSFGNTNSFSFGASNNPAPQQSAFGSSNENNSTATSATAFGSFSDTSNN